MSCLKKVSDTVETECGKLFTNVVLWSDSISTQFRFRRNKTVVDQEAFHTKWYKKASDFVSGHEKSNKRNSECSTFGEWYTEDGSESLQCPICEQCFHETCFYV